MVELMLIRDFVIPSWELARYTRHRAVGFDRKFKETLETQLQHLQSQKWHDVQLSRLRPHCACNRRAN